MRSYQDNKDDLEARLRRVEGQVRGIRHMVDDDRYCIDVLTQIAAASAALRGVGLLLLEDHLRHCLTSEEEQSIAEAIAAVERLLKS